MKKAYSLHKQVWILAVITSIIIALGVATPALIETYSYVRTSTSEMLEVTCENESEQINADFDAMEKSVQIMETYIMSMINSSSDYTVEASRDELIAETEEMFREVSQNTDGAIAYYLRFDPSFSSSTSGVFYTKTKINGNFYKEPVTDISIYSKDDVEHVGWFWQPYEKGGPLWMEPYYNKNIDVMMISYIIPLYFQGDFVGVVGMDFEYSLLTNTVDSIKVMENGYAQLEKNGLITYHATIEAGSAIPDVSDKYMKSSEMLRNGMTLTVMASYGDMSRINLTILLKMLVIVAGALIIISVILIFFVRRFTNPIERLAKSAAKLAAGDYEVEIVHSRTKEIEVLATSFEDMALKLREHSRLQHLLAYRDSMTGLRNTTSYKAWLDDLDIGTEGGVSDFAVVILDLNYLKETNDKYGHDLGNKLIVAAAQIISDAFKRSPVFRIGGDEFLAVLQDRDLAESATLIKAMQERCSTEYVDVGEEKIPISIACGVARYDPEKDNSFMDVFNRADDAMYQNKREMKGLA